MYTLKFIYFKIHLEIYTIKIVYISYLYINLKNESERERERESRRNKISNVIQDN